MYDPAGQGPEAALAGVLALAARCPHLTVVTNEVFSGGADYEDFAQIFGADGEYDGSTVGGWVVQQLGRLPEPGDCLDWRDLHIEVLRVEQRRVMEIRVSARPEDGEPLPEQ